MTLMARYERLIDRLLAELKVAVWGAARLAAVFGSVGRGTAGESTTLSRSSEGWRRRHA